MIENNKKRISTFIMGSKHRLSCMKSQSIRVVYHHGRQQKY